MDSTTLYLIFVLLGGAPQVQPSNLAACAPGVAAPPHAQSVKTVDCGVKGPAVARDANTPLPHVQLQPVVKR